MMAFLSCKIQRGYPVATRRLFLVGPGFNQHPHDINVSCFGSKMQRCCSMGCIGMILVGPGFNQHPNNISMAFFSSEMEGCCPHA